MAAITLTLTPQSIPNSNLGCIFKANDTFMYSYGSVSPTKGMVGNSSDYIDYNGKSGVLWVWGINPSITNVCEYIVSQEVSSGALSYTLIGAATTNATLVSAGEKSLFTVNISNDTISKIYVKMYNKATAPVVGTDTPVSVYLVPANSFRDITVSHPQGVYYSLGIGFATTGLQGNLDLTAVLAGVTISVRYK